MINQVYQLISPKMISVSYTDISFSDKVIIRPEYMAICHADQRYFQGQRDARVLRQKLPMALIHECCGRVVYDPAGIWQSGQKVVMIPNTPVREEPLIYENYRKGSYFLSSGHDGFMRELVEMDRDRVVAYAGIDGTVAAITEFISVAVHAATRFDRAAHEIRERVGIWGDGSLAYTVANVLRVMFPELKIAVIGQQMRKLSQFSFVNETYLAGEMPEDFEVDHAFECCGGEGSYEAIQDIIRYINPQGTLMLMGVSENKVPVNTRMVLEKGMTFIGCSRSGRSDFEKAIAFMENTSFQQHMKVIVHETAPVRTIEDIYNVFAEDLMVPFKTVFLWRLS